MQLLVRASSLVVASPERADACCDGGGVFSLEVRERCMASRLFSRTMSACAVPAALLCSRCLYDVLFRRFSGVDFVRLRVLFVAGCASLGAERFIVCRCGVPCRLPLAVLALLQTWRESVTL
jgi:hypothetical protein